MDKILSFGGGLQTTALAILLAERKFQVDAVVFSDTGGEKPETYYYIENYIKPLLSSIGVEFITVKHAKETLYEHCQRLQNIPSIKWRWCTDKFKIRPINKIAGKAIQLIGFSSDEAHRSQREFKRIKTIRQFPLIEMGLSSSDCHRIIADYGFPRPVKSSCYFCPFARLTEWKWLQSTHPHLFQQALDLEENWFKKRPQNRNNAGLLQGRPLRYLAEGKQIFLPFDAEYSCYFGYCGH